MSGGSDATTAPEPPLTFPAPVSGGSDATTAPEPPFTFWSVQNGRRRRVYTLTRKGGRALGEQASAWQSFSRAMTGALEPAT